MEPFQLSTLGRSVQLGDFYDITTDVIIGTRYAVASNKGQDLNTHSGLLKSSVTFNLHQAEEFRWGCLKFINSHFRSSILAGLMSKTQFWFYPYLKGGVRRDDVAYISVHLDVVDRVQQLADMHLKELVKLGHSLAKSTMEYGTHIVKEMSYGVNYIMTFEKTVSRPEERDDVESELYLEIERAIQDLIDGNFQSSKEIYYSNLLESTTCRIYSSLHPGNPKITSFSDCVALLQNDLGPHKRRELIPIEMVLLPLPETLNRITRYNDISLDLLNAIFLLNSAVYEVQDKCHKLLQDAIFSRAPFLSDRLKEFQRCLDKLTTELKLGVIDYRRGKWTPTQMSTVFKHFWNAYFEHGDLIKWLITRRIELNAIKSVLADVALPLITEEQLTSFTSCSVKVFFLQTVKVEDSLISRLRKELKLVDQPTNSWMEFKLIYSSNREALRHQLLKFQEKNIASTTADRLILLSTSITKEDGWRLSLVRPSFIEAADYKRTNVAYAPGFSNPYAPTAMLLSTSSEPMKISDSPTKIPLGRKQHISDSAKHQQGVSPLRNYREARKENETYVVNSNKLLSPAALAQSTTYSTSSFTLRFEQYGQYLGKVTLKPDLLYEPSFIHQLSRFCSDLPKRFTADILKARQQSFLIMDFENPKFQPRLNKSLPCMSNRLAGSRLDVGLMAYWQPYARDTRDRTLRWQCVFLLRDSNLLSSQYQHDKSCRFASVTEGESVLLSLSMRRRNQRSGLTVTWEAI